MHRTTFRSSRIPNIRFLWTIFLIAQLSRARAQQESQNPLTLNGGSVLAMAGKDCVALAVDRRFGKGPALVTIAPRELLSPSPNLLVAFTGLEGDIHSLKHELEAILASQVSGVLQTKQSVTERSPKSMASLASHVLYNRKKAPYYVEPIIAGLDSNRMPYLCSMDMIGALSTSKTFVCAGAAASGLFGTAEAYWKPDMTEKELLEACGNAFASALERDCMSGYGAIIYLITRDGIKEYVVGTRND